MSARAAVLVAVAALRAWPGAAQVVDTIIVENANIFDALDPNPVARWANALHITTSPWVVRRTILLREGQPFDSARVVESARALRDLGVFRFVRIDTLHVDGRLAVRVRTADGWSTRPTLGFSTTAGDATWTVGAREQNFLGSAITLGLLYRDTPDRNGLEFEFFNPHFFARHVIVQAFYRNYSDGRRTEWVVGRPFRETVARWSLRNYGVDGRERALVFRDGVLDSTVRRSVSVVGLRGGVALAATPRGYTRVWADVHWRREDYSPDTAGARPAYSTFVAAGAGVELNHVRLREVDHFNSYGRSEDVDLSQVLRLGVWAAPRAWGYPSGRAGVGPEIAGQLSAVWRGGFGIVRAAGRGVYDAAGLDSGRVVGSITLVSQNLARQTLILHSAVAAAEGPAPGAELDPWLQREGPRLFGAHAFTGTRSTWVVLEDRVVLDHDWGGLVGVGLAPFVEWGGAWYADEARRTGGNLGLALRTGPTRSAQGSAFELAVGWRFGDGWDDKRWAVTFRSAFRYADR